MKIRIKEFNVDWLTIKNLCRKTVSMGDSSIEPSEEWKKKLLIARHSPLRSGVMLIELDDIPYFVHTHLVRHNVGVVPFVGTSREDRTGVKRNERKQTDLISMDLLVNIESLMNISEKRLCNCADIETIKVWKAVLEEVKKYDKDIYWACTPSCVRTGGCIEGFSNCNYYDSLMNGVDMETQTNITKRYDYYNKRRK